MAEYDSLQLADYDYGRAHSNLLRCQKATVTWSIGRILWLCLVGIHRTPACRLERNTVCASQENRVIPSQENRVIPHKYNNASNMS